MSQPDEIEALTASLLADLEAMHERILDELNDLALAWFDMSATARARRLRTLDAHVVALMNQADSLAARSVLQAAQTAYETGAWTTALLAGTTAAFAGIDTDAITALARDAMRDLLSATQGVRADVKDLIRDLTRDQVRAKLYTGQTAEQAGKDLAKALAARGINAITYANGAKVPLPVYAQMVVRTKTAEAYQEGGLNQGERLEIDWWEILDGPGCGWTSHDDPQKANGMIVPIDAAREHTLSHPNCRRSSSPRPDITSLREAQDAQPTAPTSMDSVWGQALAAQQAARRAVAVSATPARSTAAVATSAGAIPATAAGRKFAATLARHAG